MFLFAHRTAVWLAAFGLVALAHPAIAQTYTVVDLGVSLGIARGINDPGEVVGVGSFGGSNRGFLWDGGTAAALPDLISGCAVGNCSDARAINPARTIAGVAATSCGTLHAVVWADSSLPVDLGTLTGLCATYSAALAINPAGDIVGESGTTSGPSHATLWANNAATPVDLGLVPGSTGSLSQARGISPAGDIVGISEYKSGFNYGFLWQRGTMTALLPLSAGQSAEAIAINARGDVVGASQVPGDIRAVLWRRGSTTPVDLGGPSGTGFRYANAINDRGDIVGQMAIIVTGESRAFVKPQGGVVRDLNDLGPTTQGWVFSIALGINNRGEIIGWGHRIGEVENRALLLVP